MPMVMKEPTIAANTTNDNVLSGSAFEFARSRGILSEGVTAAATGTFVQLQAGSDIIAEEFSPPVLTRYPIIPDEMYFSDVVENGDRIIQRVRNSTGAGIVARTALQLSYAG